MRMTARFFRWHRWLGYLVAWQVLAWIVGGLLFAWLPFQAWVKAADAVRPAQQVLPANWAQALATAALPAQALLSVQSVATASGPALKLRSATGEHWLAASGGPLTEPDAAAVSRFAQALYQGDGRLVGIERLAQVPTRWAIVRELGARHDVWVARFDDALATRIYLGGAHGEWLAARNDAWVLYDFFWRLHVMDYTEGEDFNNPLLRGTSLVAAALVLTGAVMLSLALRRAWRRH